ncbi:MAG: type IV secretory system conjugative DNA transfer family protein [Candidatus Omnitrophica bacterium]|nr:type IV secretory system conjugative DNA transfer family protein [Candidatus Omnitrophota bacterium]
MIAVLKKAFSLFGFALFSAKDKTNNTLNPFIRLGWILAKGFSSSSGMMNERDQYKIFLPSNKGLLLDGMNKRLSLKDSFNHLALISRTGGGKTTSYVIPNIFKLAKENNSMIITDISGELYENTSGYLAKNGYTIYVLNPEDLSESIGYNPLYYATDSTKIDELAGLLVSSSKDSIGKDSFWDNGAKSFISILIRVLMSTRDYRYINLANVRYLINNYGSDGKALDKLVHEYADDKTYYEFRGFIKGNPQTVLSMVSTANIALSAIGINDNLEKLTTNHSIDFNKIREEKSAIYIKIPGQKQKQYSFLLNTFYHQFFSQMMEKLPTKRDLPIFCLLDEFGNMNLPNFETTVTTIRKYNISLSLIFQDMTQIEQKYGISNASTILNGGISSKLFFNGADLSTTEMLSKILGSREKITPDPNGNFHFKDKRVMEASEIRTMKDNEALFIMGNKQPLIIKFKPFYEDFMFKRYAQTAPYKSNSKMTMEIEYIDLDFEEHTEYEED